MYEKGIYRKGVAKERAGKLLLCPWDVLHNMCKLVNWDSNLSGMRHSSIRTRVVPSSHR